MASPSLRQTLQLDATSCADGALLLSLHPDGSRLAAARGPLLCICQLVPSLAHEDTAGVSSTSAAAEEEQALQERRRTHRAAGPSRASRAEQQRFVCPSATGPPSVSPDDITALAWLAFARPPGAQDGTGPDHWSGGGASGGGPSRPGAAQLQSRSSSSRRRTNSAGSGGGVFASIQVMLEDHELSQQRRQQQQQQPGPGGPPPAHPGYSLVVLLAGTRGGCLQLHDADSGALLLRQQVHAGPVRGIALRTWRMGLKPDDAVEDVTVCWADAVARIATWELRTAATTCYAAAAAKARGDSGGGHSRFGLWGSSAAAGPEIKPIVAQKWEVPAAARGRSCAVCCGQRPRDLYSLLQQGVGNSTTATGKTIFIAGGGRPACLAALEVDEQSPGGGGALSYISSVATSVSSGVMGLARTARNVAAAPLALRDGLRYFMNPLQLGLSSNHNDHDQPSSHDQPLASFADASAGQRAPATGVWRQHRDEGRAVQALAPAPHGSLVAAVDNLGRVLLVEAGAMLVSRMWKGYRDAQVGWMEVRASAVDRLMQRQRAEQSGAQGGGEGAEQGSPVGAPEDSAEHGEAPGADTAANARVGTEQARRHNAQPPLVPRPRPRAGAGAGVATLEAGLANARRSNTPALQPQNLLQSGSSQAQRGPSAAAGDAGSVGCSRSDDPYVLLLVLYAPRRQSLELWWPLHGDRLAAAPAPPRARLLQRSGGGCGGGGELGTWRVADAASAAAPPMTPAGCMLCCWEQGPSEPQRADGWDSEAWEQWPDADAAAGSSNEAEGLVLRELADVFGLHA